MASNSMKKHASRFIPPLTALRAFEAAARLKSLTKASEELNVTRAAVSQQVKQLEHYLSATLFERNGSRLVLTDDAEYYLPLLTQVFDTLSIGTAQLFERKRRHLLTLHIAQSLCYQWLLPKLADFRQCYPEIDLKISTTSNPYPKTNQNSDIEIINGTLTSGQKATFCFPEEYWVVVASPEYLKKRPISTPQELADADKLATLGYSENWQYWFDFLDYRDVIVRPHMQFDHSLLAIKAASVGLGVLLVKETLVEEPLSRGELSRIGGWRMPSRTLHYVLCHNTRNNYAIEFVSWMRKHLSKTL